VDVVGQSLGGCVGMDLAARHPTRVRRIVATSSQPVAHPSSNTAIGRQARARLYGGVGPTVPKMRRLVSRLEWWDPDAVPEATVMARFANSSRPEAVASMASPDGHGTAQDLAELLPRVAAPTLVVFGRHDPFAPPAYARHVAASLPTGRAHIVDRTAHHPQEERPREYLRVVQRFLDP
jgi:pimeloyl-ACP methyl ester carboxylesterase